MNSIENKDELLKTSDFVREFKTFYKILYYLGCLKQKRFLNIEGHPYQYCSNAYYNALFTFRLWNPISIIVICMLWVLLFLLNIAESFVNTNNDIADMNNTHIKIRKPTIKLK